MSAISDVRFSGNARERLVPGVDLALRRSSQRHLMTVQAVPQSPTWQGQRCEAGEVPGQAPGALSCPSALELTTSNRICHQAAQALCL